MGEWEVDGVIEKLAIWLASLADDIRDDAPRMEMVMGIVCNSCAFRVYVPQLLVY